MATKPKFYVFDKIVKTEDDLVGLVAYSRYKYKKVQKIKELKREANQDYIPNDNESLLEFQEAMIQVIPELRAASREWLDIVAHKIVEIQMEDFKKCAVDAFQQIKPTFWGGVLQNLVAAIIFTAIVALVYYAKKNGLI